MSEPSRFIRDRQLEDRMRQHAAFDKHTCLPSCSAKPADELDALRASLQRAEEENERLRDAIQDMRQHAYTARANVNSAIWTVEEIGKHEEERWRREKLEREDAALIAETEEGNHDE